MNDAVVARIAHKKVARARRAVRVAAAQSRRAIQARLDSRRTLWFAVEKAAHNVDSLVAQRAAVNAYAVYSSDIHISLDGVLALWRCPR